MVTDKARREAQRTRQENRRLQQQANMTEAALNDIQQQLNTYRDIPNITADELLIDQAELGAGSFGGNCKRIHTGLINNT
jgi:uncharacterized protein YlxW (UPF0749 family)